MSKSQDTPASALPIAHRGLRHVALRVRDVARAKHFYEQVFGMRAVWEPDAHTAYLSGGADNLALHEHAQATRAPAEQQALDHIGFLVASAAEVYAAADAARAAGVTILQQPREHRDGSHSFYLADPDGNVVQVLFEPTISPRL